MIIEKVLEERGFMSGLFLVGGGYGVLRYYLVRFFDVVLEFLVLVVIVVVSIVGINNNKCKR